MEEEVEGIPLLHHHLLCWVWMGQVEVGSPWSFGQRAAGEEAGCGRRSDGRASRTAVRDKVKQSALVAAVVEDHLCLSEEVGVAPLHVLAVVLGFLADLTGPGEEAGGQGGLEEAEGPVQSGQSLALEVEGLVCRVEVVEVL